jgi:hypothetical protein
MNTETNRFEWVPDGKQRPEHLGFSIGEEVIIKSYKFRIAHIDAGIESHSEAGKKPTLMVLEPIGPTQQTKEIVELNRLAEVV